MKYFRIAALFCAIILPLYADFLLVPMDNAQTDHLKAYGVAYYALTKQERAEWLLNYRAGSFIFEYSLDVFQKARLMGVTAKKISASDAADIFDEMAGKNMERVILQKAPNVAVYTPDWTAPWDDAVTLALTYAEIPYEKVWDEEALAGDLKKYDWLHLHHEDFTGQFNKFWFGNQNAPWYQRQVTLYTERAKNAGYQSVREHKGAVARMIEHYVQEGGFLFAMCTATETIDIALAMADVDFAHPHIDGTPLDADYAKKANYEKTFAFINFELTPSPYAITFSDIDYNWVNAPSRIPLTDFELFDFSAKIDPVPAMLCQSHETVIQGFYGLTTSFRRSKIKDGVTILADTPGTESVKYIHGNFGSGSFTFYGGHDPEDPNHYVMDLPTDLSLHKNSPGYRLILNNILFPAAKKEKKKT